MTTTELVCTECGDQSPPDAVGWQAYLVGVHDELDDEETSRSTARSAPSGSSTDLAVTVRRATEGDRETLYALWDEWVERESPVPSWVLNAREGTRAGIDDAVNFGSAMIAEEGDEVLGFACGVMDGPHVGELTELYVRPEGRRRGIARELLRAVVSELSERGASFLSGGVALENGAARSFYENVGFRPAELRLIADIDTIEQRLGVR